MTIDRATARKIAEAVVEQRFRPDVPDAVIVDEATVEGPTKWVFVFNSRRFIETGDFQYALAGNSPIFVSKADGSVSFGVSYQSIEDQVR